MEADPVFVKTVIETIINECLNSNNILLKKHFTPVNNLLMKKRCFCYREMCIDLHLKATNSYLIFYHKYLQKIFYVLIEIN